MALPDPRSRIVRRDEGAFRKVLEDAAKATLPLPTIGIPDLMVGVLADAQSKQTATANSYRQLETAEQARRDAAAEAARAAVQQAQGAMLSGLKIKPRE